VIGDEATSARGVAMVVPCWTRGARPEGRAISVALTEGGFTLLEVLVALAILSIAVVASIQGFAQGLRLLKLAGDHQQATLLADQKAREMVNPQEGRTEGQEESGGTTFAWETTTTAVEAPDLAPTGSAPAAWRAYRIVVHVRWGSRQVELATLRTTPISLETVTAATTPTSSGAPAAGAPPPSSAPSATTAPSASRPPTPSSPMPSSRPQPSR
jgi:general secretion pathway protein I